MWLPSQVTVCDQSLKAHQRNALLFMLMFASFHLVFSSVLSSVHWYVSLRTILAPTEKITH